MERNCLWEGCPSKKKSDNELYCRVHEKQAWIQETEKLGKKMCCNHIRGCRSQLDQTYSKSRCESCLEKEREKDRKRREKAKNKIVDDPNMQTCTVCCKTMDKSLFIGIKGETKTCQDCRDKNSIYDKNRDMEHRREMERIASRKPERKAVKMKWVEDNREKFNEIHMNYRRRQMETNKEEYLKRNAQNIKEWRQKNPEKQEEYNEKKKNSLPLQFNVYSRSAQLKNLLFDISYEYYEELVKKPCYYCGEIRERGFNGIDRLNSSVGYVNDNCVSCCSMCNYMKSSLSPNVFIGRVHHILAYQGIIEGDLYPELFLNTKQVNYSQYRYRAIQKNIEFLLSEEEFNKIIHDDCYICGKETKNYHINGIDRTNNNNGYVLDNCMACCSECNYMKREYDLQEIVHKMMSIYETHSNYILINEELVKKNIVKGNKKSQEELITLREQRKIDNYNSFMERHSKENIQHRSIKNAENRRNKK